MEIQVIDKELLEQLYEGASKTERLRQGFDLRTTSEDGSQRVTHHMNVR